MRAGQSCIIDNSPTCIPRCTQLCEPVVIYRILFEMRPVHAWWGCIQMDRDILDFRSSYPVSEWVSRTLTTQARFGGFTAFGPEVQTPAVSARETVQSSQCNLSQGSSYSPHCLSDALHRCNSGSTVPWGTGKRASSTRSERLGKRNHYAVSRSIHRASSFNEPGTPVMYGSRECQVQAFPTPCKLIWFVRAILRCEPSRLGGG
jgi:hypothetical protein